MVFATSTYLQLPNCSFISQCDFLYIFIFVYILTITIVFYSEVETTIEVPFVPHKTLHRMFDRPVPSELSCLDVFLSL